MTDRQLNSFILSRADKMPVVAVTYPRQSGKPTLIQRFFPTHTYRNLEDVELRNYAPSHPKGFLAEADQEMYTMA